MCACVIGTPAVQADWTSQLVDRAFHHTVSQNSARTLIMSPVGRGKSSFSYSPNASCVIALEQLAAAFSYFCIWCLKVTTDIIEVARVANVPAPPQSHPATQDTVNLKTECRFCLPTSPNY